MKKGFLILIYVITMLVWQGSVALGEGEGHLYVEGHLVGQNELDSTTANNKSNTGSVWGMDAAVGLAKVSVESYNKTVGDTSYISRDTKVGFALINDEIIRLDATISNQDLKLTNDVDPSNNVDYNGYLCGLDMRMNLSEKLVLESDVNYSVKSTSKTSTTGDDKLLTYQVKCSWMPWDCFGFSLAYRYYSYRSDSVTVDDFKGVYFGFSGRFKNITNGGDGVPKVVWDFKSN